MNATRPEIAFIFSMACLGLSLLATPFALSWMAGPSDCPPAVCCGEQIAQLFDRIERLQAEVRHQTQQKINAMQDKQPLQEQVRELEQELAACQAHVAFGEPYEVRQK